MNLVDVTSRVSKCMIFEDVILRVSSGQYHILFINSKERCYNHHDNRIQEQSIADQKPHCLAQHPKILKELIQNEKNGNKRQNENTFTTIQVISRLGNPHKLCRPSL